MDSPLGASNLSPRSVHDLAGVIPFSKGNELGRDVRGAPAMEDETRRVTAQQLLLRSDILTCAAAAWGARANRPNCATPQWLVNERPEVPSRERSTHGKVRPRFGGTDALRPPDRPTLPQRPPATLPPAVRGRWVLGAERKVSGMRVAKRGTRVEQRRKSASPDTDVMPIRRPDVPVTSARRTPS